MLQVYAAIGGVALLLCAGAYGVFKYQENTIQSLTNEVSLLTQEAEAFKLELKDLEANISAVQSTVSVYKTNQQNFSSEAKKLKDSVSRLETIIAKPTLVSRKIEASYNKFHLDKACMSGNTEACYAKKDTNSK